MLIAFWQDDRTTLRTWYVNLQDPFRRSALGFDYLDQELDVIVSPDLERWRWKDEEKFEALVREGHIPPSGHASFARSARRSCGRAASRARSSRSAGTAGSRPRTGPFRPSRRAGTSSHRPSDGTDRAAHPARRRPPDAGRRGEGDRPGRLLGDRHPRPDSDVDVGLYYHPDEPLDIAALRAVAEDLNDAPDPVVTEPGGWGRWVNGGAWLTVDGQRVDFIYRDLAFVSEIVDECQQGKTQFDYYQQPPYGFRSPIYLAEIAFARVLHDPFGAFERLKGRVTGLPPALRAGIVQGFLGETEFSLLHAEKFAHRGDPLFVAGCLTRIVTNLIQVTYALNAVLFISEKKFYADLETFQVKPERLLDKLNGLVEHIGASPDELMATVQRARALFDELVELARQCDLPFRPRF